LPIINIPETGFGGNFYREFLVRMNLCTTSVPVLAQQLGKLPADILVDHGKW